MNQHRIVRLHADGVRNPAGDCLTYRARRVLKFDLKGIGSAFLSPKRGGKGAVGGKGDLAAAPRSAGLSVNKLDRESGNIFTVTGHHSAADKRFSIVANRLVIQF